MSELVLRPSTDDDVEAFLDVAQRSFLRQTGRAAHWTSEGMRRMRALPSRDPALDLPVVVRGEQVVAWAGVYANAPYTEIFTDLHLDPDLTDDEAATATGLLVEHASARGVQVAAGSPPRPGRTIAIEAIDTDDRLVGDLERLGFARDRYEYEMAIELGDTVPEPPAWPSGVRVRPIGGPEDAEVVTAVLADAFADHPGNVPFSAEVIDHVLGGDNVDVHATALAFDEEGPVGLALTRGRPGVGYVWVLGVVSRARRRGLGEALLRHAFHAYAASGTSLVLLDVDGSNDSGALTLYANAGMAPRTTKIVLTRLLDD